MASRRIIARAFLASTLALAAPMLEHADRASAQAIVEHGLISSRVARTAPTAGKRAPRRARGDQS
ncbi:MAG TPA: hypothetical protein VFD83_03810, partial [Candidatus Polarisedimenticolia bacterium]|nr:hypothetical protein [Candidatus Polarisedimenticolia bacterium]